MIEQLKAMATLVAQNGRFTLHVNASGAFMFVDEVLGELVSQKMVEAVGYTYPLPDQDTALKLLAALDATAEPITVPAPIVSEPEPITVPAPIEPEPIEPEPIATPAPIETPAQHYLLTKISDTVDLLKHLQIELPKVAAAAYHTVPQRVSTENPEWPLIAFKADSETEDPIQWYLVLGTMATEAEALAIQTDLVSRTYTRVPSLPLIHTATKAFGEDNPVWLCRLTYPQAQKFLSACALPVLNF